ncbi:DUF1178 family protein [Accumulibacter sp.]|jgi:hypothetical protein|uniref:DUF1178 family protein n=1 Tax=Accumulibacter sp. TaxID=2053492 RepID=UPI001ACCCF99|nr:DUF1178 family protein [Accumulibacter sp.]MBN8455172.1 DUF1178 family protein [Accumulibacter sp.]MBO3706294.1 DUF1178 family protein [Candidatus Accumulibacter conexus]
MIIFDLACQHDHQFEGWFQSREDFDSQLASGLISCPHCGSLDIRRVPSTVHLGRSGTQADPPRRESPVVVPAVDGRAGALQAFRHMTELLLANCEDVGADFAEEARRIHYVEAPERSIRGVATAEEYAELLDEGIEVFRVQRVKPGDLH